MTALPLWGRTCLLLLLGSSAALFTLTLLRSAPVQRAIARYVESLDATLARMLAPARARFILSLQIIAALLCLGSAIALRAPALIAPALAAAILPTYALRYLQKKRRERIEAKLDMLALALANATRATPSVGRALSLLQTSLSAPLDAEIAQVLRELRIGSSLEQALLNFSWRVQSPPLDALLSSVLVARRVGGDLPAVLETTAHTLREMARLEGVLRSKTAQGRTQMWVLGCCPPFLALAFNAVKPGYFEPLTASPIGMTLLVTAVFAWLCAIVLARKILAVEL